MKGGYPVKVSKVSMNDRVIFINQQKENLYLQKGTIVFRKKVSSSKYTYIVEFDNNVRSKDHVSSLCSAKMGYGAFVSIEEIRKIKKENFSIKDYEKKLLKILKKKARKAEETNDNQDITQSTVILFFL